MKAILNKSISDLQDHIYSDSGWNYSKEQFNTSVPEALRARNYLSKLINVVRRVSPVGLGASVVYALSGLPSFSGSLDLDRLITGTSWAVVNGVIILTSPGAEIKADEELLIDYAKELDSLYEAKEFDSWFGKPGNIRKLERAGYSNMDDLLEDFETYTGNAIDFITKKVGFKNQGAAEFAAERLETYKRVVA